MELNPSIRLCILPYSWMHSVFLAAFRGLRCAFGHLLSSALRPTSVRSNGIAKTATFGSSAERKGKRMPGSGHFSRILKPFLCCQLWCEMLPKLRDHVNRRNCRTKPAKCNVNAEQKSKDSLWRSFLIDRICQGAN